MSDAEGAVEVSDDAEAADMSDDAEAADDDDGVHEQLTDLFRLCVVGLGADPPASCHQ